MSMVFEALKSAEREFPGFGWPLIGEEQLAPTGRHMAATSDAEAEVVATLANKLAQGLVAVILELRRQDAQEIRALVDGVRLQQEKLAVIVEGLAQWKEVSSKVDAVAQRLSGQAEVLRLLREAERQRQEALHEVVKILKQLAGSTLPHPILPEGL